MDVQRVFLANKESVFYPSSRTGSPHIRQMELSLISRSVYIICLMEKAKREKVGSVNDFHRMLRKECDVHWQGRARENPFYDGDPHVFPLSLTVPLALTSDYAIFLRLLLEEARTLAAFTWEERGIIAPLLNRLDDLSLAVAVMGVSIDG